MIDSPYQLVPAGQTSPLRPGGAAIAGPLQEPGTILLPPQLFPPENAISLNLSANQAIVGAGAVFTPSALSTRIPPNCYGVISSIDLVLDAIVLTSDVRWSLLINGVPVAGWNAITILGRDGAASVSKTWEGPLRIMIPLGGTVGVRIVDVDGGAYVAGTQLYGWFWPQRR
jgi:hypothetical protein